MKPAQAVVALSASLVVLISNLLSTAPAPRPTLGVLARPEVMDFTRGDVTTDGYTPAQVRRAYDVGPVDAAIATGRVVAVVVAFHQPGVESDLGRFDLAFDLWPLAGLDASKPCDINLGPHPCFRRLYAGDPPPQNPAWGLETALDTQWVHALSPRADVLLVEAQSDHLNDLMAAVDLAVSRRPNVILMSWGVPEEAVELTDDHRFERTDTAFVAPVGDAPGMVDYPAASPYVLAVGGTSLVLDAMGGRISETAWPDGGGGLSQFEPQPVYQAAAAAPLSSRMRAVPDVAANGDYAMGYAVVMSDAGGQASWHKTAGSSGAAAVWAGLLSLAQANCSHRVDVDPYVAHLYEAPAIGAAPRAYDLRTGLGPPDAAALLPHMCVPGGSKTDG